MSSSSDRRYWPKLTFRSYTDTRVLFYWPATLFTRRFVLCAWLIVVLMLGIASAQADPPRRTAVVGHRGLMHQAPECTLPAFKACLALGVGFEFDVRRTNDGELVCLHDATLDRTTSGRGKLAQRSLAEIRALDAGSRFDAAFAGTRVPTIEQIFELVATESRGRAVLAVDLKEAGDGLEQVVVELAQRQKVLDQLLFIGLTIESPGVRGRLKAASPGAQTARLAAAESDIESVLADRQSDWVYLRYLPSPPAIKRIHEAGKKAFLAGPLVAGLEPDNWKAATVLGFDAILTDHPLELARQQRQGFHTSK
jgi:glycerophosphoryl diester phosphodiesterase